MTKNLEELTKIYKQASELFQYNLDKLVELEANPETRRAELLLQADKIRITRGDLVAISAEILKHCQKY